MMRDQKTVNGVTYEWFSAEELESGYIERGPCVRPSLDEESINAILKSGAHGVWISNPMKRYTDTPQANSYQAIGGGYYEYVPGTSNVLKD